LPGNDEAEPDDGDWQFLVTPCEGVPKMQSVHHSLCIAKVQLRPNPR